MGSECTWVGCCLGFGCLIPAHTMYFYAHPSQFISFLFCFLSKKRGKRCIIIITYLLGVVLGLYQYNTFLDYIPAGNPKLLRTRPIERSRDLA